MNQKKTLVVLAAGMGSRFAGGIKQLYPVGPNGEVLMDYSIFDALEAGFNRVVFIIRKDIEELFEESIGRRIRPVCKARGVEVICAYQDRNVLPGGFQCPVDRTKPWGTSHALLACKGLLDGPFVVINADDYYGKDAYHKAVTFLNKQEDWAKGAYGLVGFCLRNTLSTHGGVNRGICTVDEHLWLSGIRETRDIRPNGTDGYYEEDGVRYELEGDVPVSMNMWCFSGDVLEQLEAGFEAFLAEHVENPKAEYLIPDAIEELLQAGSARVKVLLTDSQWFGMTYMEDMPMVKEAFQKMAEEGTYPSPLFG